MSDLHEDFASFLRSLLRSPKPIVILSSLRDFVLFWRDFADFIVLAAERNFGRTARRFAELVYGKEPLTVSVVPRSDYYVVYVKDQRNFEDLYLAVSTAHASASSGFFPVPIPVMSPRFLTASVKRSMNPALVERLFVVLPFVSSIPCNDALSSMRFLRDSLTVKCASYMLSNDLAYNVLGLVLSSAIARAGAVPSYRTSFDHLLGVAIEGLRKLGADARVLRADERYLDVEVSLLLVVFD